VRIRLKLLLAAASTVTLAAQTTEKVTFLRDVAPILNKVGCSSGPCHGAAKGKNGFKLSLRGYDPDFDYQALLYDLSGRRFNRSDPGRSLMLAKPTQEVAHGGGLRIEPGSAYYKTIYAWIAQGVPFGDPSKDKVERIEMQPAEVEMAKPGLEQPIKVVAHYMDGGERDVTKEAVIASNIPDTADITADAAVKGVRIGEATMLVRYEGKFGTVPVTVLNPKPGFAWKQYPQNNYIDQLVDAKLRRLKIQPSPAVDDATFVRRVSADLTGQLPTPAEVRQFVADSTPSRAKRAKMIDNLMARKSYVDHWTLKWGDLLQNDRKYLGDKSVWEFQEWIRESVATNKRYDVFVHELLTSRGSSNENPATNYFRVTRDAKPTMEKTTQVFLGVRMVCTQCHDHPFERWTQNQYYEMTSFFSTVGIRPGFESGEEIVYDKRDDFDVRHPKDDRVMKPKFLVSATVASVAPVALPNDANRRQAFADWITSPENPFFAKSMANRVWSYFTGKGIIDPVDDIRASNPPSNEALLNALTKDFKDHDFDVKHLIRTIVNSRVYQAGIETNEWNGTDKTNFSHAIPRRLNAEQLMDALTQATGVRPNYPEIPANTTAEEFPDPHVGKDGFLDLFGRPQRESAGESERKTDLSLPQALNLVNGKTISDAIADPTGRIAKALISGESDRSLIEEIYLVTLSRLPLPNEMDQSLTYLRGGEGRASRAQDLLWALVNSKSFLYNR
jgi:Protein of unknown function (DUF1549)/Protein of unknown function (DUF1553)